MSLLTQFYPGPGSGGSTEGGGGYANSPCVVLGGKTVNPTFTSLQNMSGSVSWYPNTTADYLGNISGGTYEYITINSGNINVISALPSVLKKIIFNGCAVGSLQDPGTARPDFTGIYGSGTVSYLALSGNCSNFTTISTDINIVAGVNTVSVTNAALDATSVNHVLVSVANTGGVAVGVSTPLLDLSGGTSAGNGALTAAGLAAKNALVAGGWTVTLNP